MQTHGSLHLYVVFVWFFFKFGCFILFSFDFHLSVVFYYCSLDARLFSNERQKGYESGWKGGGEDLGGERGGETVIRIYCMGKHLFSIKDKVYSPLK